MPYKVPVIRHNGRTLLVDKLVGNLYSIRDYAFLFSPDIFDNVLL
jgi:hypothetical protein